MGRERLITRDSFGNSLSSGVDSQGNPYVVDQNGYRQTTYLAQRTPKETREFQEMMNKSIDNILRPSRPIETVIHLNVAEPAHERIVVSQEIIDECDEFVYYQKPGGSFHHQKLYDNNGDDIPRVIVKDRLIRKGFKIVTKREIEDSIKQRRL